jgi:hypothetical protein
VERPSPSKIWEKWTPGREISSTTNFWSTEKQRGTPSFSRKDNFTGFRPRPHFLNRNHQWTRKERDHGAHHCISKNLPLVEKFFYTDSTPEDIVDVIELFPQLFTEKNV